ncbi:MAG: hypothetical protein ACI9SP_000239 [Arenicella sp.]|jgi:hypothetical protein
MASHYNCVKWRCYLPTFFGSCLYLVTLVSLAADFEVGAQLRIFNSVADPKKEVLNPALFASVEESYVLPDKSSISFELYGRYDSQDEERNLVDIRQLKWQKNFDNFDITLGYDVIYWGVAESQQLVNVVNQTDAAEGINVERKLGQPLLGINYISDWGNFEFYSLLGFQERSLPGPDGRLGGIVTVDSDRALFESNKGDDHVDFAARWSSHYNGVDIGVSYFSGTSREPDLIFDTSAVIEEIDDILLIPKYNQVDSYSIDAQYISAGFLWKLEWIKRDFKQQADYNALTLGLEYTQVGVFGTRSDFGWVAEYLYDDRGDSAPNAAFESDLFLALRWVQNNLDNNEALFGLIYDPDSGEKVFSLEYQFSLTDSIKIEIEGLLFEGGQAPAFELTEVLNALQQPDPDNRLFFIQNDDFLGIKLRYYF